MLRTRKPKTGYKRTRKDARYDNVRVGRTLAPSKTELAGVGGYAQAILAPLSFRSGGARIPDLCTYRTATCSLQLEVTVAALGGACAGGYLVLHSNGCRYFTEASGSTDGTITMQSTAVDPSSNTWTGNTATTGNTLVPGSGSLATNSTAYRVVGAGLQVEFIGNDTNNKGSITAIALQSSDSEELGLFYLQSASALENFRANYTGAAKNGVSLRYHPSDAMDLDFGGARSPAVADFSNQRYDANNYGAKCFGGLQWHASGIDTGVSFRVTMRIHLEVLPATEYSDLDTSASPVSSSVLESVLIASAMTPQVGPAKTPEYWSKVSARVQANSHEPGFAQAKTLASAAMSPWGHIGADKYGYA